MSITAGIYTMVVVSIERVRCVLPARGHNVPTPAGSRSIGMRGTIIALAIVWMLSFCVAVPAAINFDVGVADDTDHSGNETVVVCHTTWNSTFTVDHNSHISGWIFTLLVPMETGMNTLKNSNKIYVCHTTWNSFRTSAYSLFLLVVSYLLPQAVLYVNYGRLAAYLWHRRRAVAAASSQAQPVEASSRSGRHGGASGSTPVARSTLKTIKMLATVAILFLIAWAPYFTITTIEVIHVFS